MAYREIAMWEILEVLRRVARGEGHRAIARVPGHSRSTIRRWLRVAAALGWEPATGGQAEEPLAVAVAQRVRPVRTSAEPGMSQGINPGGAPAGESSEADGPPARLHRLRGPGRGARRRSHTQARGEHRRTRVRVVVLVERPDGLGPKLRELLEEGVKSRSAGAGGFGSFLRRGVGHTINPHLYSPRGRLLLLRLEGQPPLSALQEGRLAPRWGQRSSGGRAFV